MKRPTRKRRGFKPPKYYEEDPKSRKIINNAKRFVLSFEVDPEFYKRFQKHLYTRGAHHGLQSAILREALELYLDAIESNEKPNEKPSQGVKPS